MQEQLKEIYELNNSLLKLAENLQDEFSHRKIKRDTLTADLYLLCFFFTKASKSASAIVLLCQEGYCEDAYILARSVFEILVKSLYIFKTDSIERARAFILYDNLEKRKQFRKIVNWNKEKGRTHKDMEKELDKAEKICVDLEKDYQIDTVKVRWPQKRLEELSKEVDLLHQYYTSYWISSLYVHTLARSSRSFVSQTDSGLSFYIGPTEKLSKDVLIWSFDLFGRLVREFDNQFDLGYKEKISEIEEEFNKFMQSAMNEE